MSMVIGIGNEYRRDDGLGLHVARLLRDQYLPEVTVKEESGEGLALMEAWQGAEQAVLCDAVSSGAAPGTVHRFDAHLDTIPTSFFHYSTHAFSVAEAVELARTLDRLPPRLVIYGVEGSDFSAGQGLSPVVESAAIDVVMEIRRLLGVDPGEEPEHA